MTVDRQVDSEVIQKKNWCEVLRVEAMGELFNKMAKLMFYYIFPAMG